MECVRQYISDVLDFMADMHTLTKLKVRGLHPLISQGSERGRHSQGTEAARWKFILTWRGSNGSVE